MRAFRPSRYCVGLLHREAIRLTKLPLPDGPPPGFHDNDDIPF